VLVDALCYSTPLDFLGRLALAPLVGGFTFKQLWGKAAFRAYFRDRYFSTESGRAAQRLEHYYDTFNTPAARASALSTLRATRDTRAVVADIARISVPTLVIWGREDAVFPAALGQRMAREIRDAGFELVAAGHAPQEERPESVAAAIQRFASGTRPG
jgi:pimeloyl-ACP methyl ester carboxylesterase